VKKVKEFKLSAEANIVSIFYKNPDLLYSYDNLRIEDISNNIWRVYYVIAQDIVIKEKKQTLDEVTVGLYLEKHDKLKAKYEEYGGYETIEKATEYVKEENIDGYITELHKWNAVLQLLKNKFPVYDRLSDFADMDIEQIYSYYETHLNHIFINADGDVKSYNLCEGINDLIDRLDKGSGIGLPLNESQILNKEISGNNLGHITMLGALSGAGKSTTTIELIFPSILKYDENLCMIINEEDQDKIRKEMIVWVANNIFHVDFQKYKLRDGNFSTENMELLRKCAKWIEDKKESRHITIIPLERYTTEIAIKIIKKYSSLGVKYFVLDTLKASSDSKTDVVWLEMQRDMVKLYDVIKPSQKNVHLWVTYQLGKEATKKRYYSNQEIGMSKSIVDVASVNLMMRKPFDDEYAGERNELKCYRLEGKNKLTKIPFKLEKDKQYAIIFITKNRFGATQQFQIVAEHDLSRNIYNEVGIVNIPLDW
jgi:replicative DNA helicase